MLAITGSMNIWYVANVKDMRMGRRRLLEIVRDRFPNPYNGDLFAFMSKDHRLMKMVRYESHLYMLYELEYQRGYKFMQPVYEDGQATYFQLDFKYLVALLKCPVVSKLRVS